MGKSEFLKHENLWYISIVATFGFCVKILREKKCYSTCVTVPPICFLCFFTIRICFILFIYFLCKYVSSPSLLFDCHMKGQVSYLLSCHLKLISSYIFVFLDLLSYKLSVLPIKLNIGYEIPKK